VEILVVAAFPPELEGVDGVAVGIGMAAAAAGTQRALAERRPEGILLVGTCGVYPGHPLSIGSVVVARRVHLVSTAVVEGRGGFPPRMDDPIDATLTPPGSAADVATTLAVTIDDALAATITARTACQVEHLEAHAVASVCARAGVAFGALLGIANVVGSRARDEWRANHELAGNAAAAAVKGWLSARNA
jgi:futalosine hydrolase